MSRWLWPVLGSELGNMFIKAVHEHTNWTPFICIHKMPMKIRKLKTRSDRAPRAALDKWAGGWRWFMWGPEGLIRGLSGAVSALARGLRSCFYSTASQFLPRPVHEGADRQSPRPSEKDNSICFYDRDQVLMSGGSLLPVLCLTYRFRYFSKHF